MLPAWVGDSHFDANHSPFLPLAPCSAAFPARLGAVGGVISSPSCVCSRLSAPIHSHVRARWGNCLVGPIRIPLKWWRSQTFQQPEFCSVCNPRPVSCEVYILLNSETCWFLKSLGTHALMYFFRVQVWPTKRNNMVFHCHSGAFIPWGCW